MEHKLQFDDFRTLSFDKNEALTIKNVPKILIDKMEKEEGYWIERGKGLLVSCLLP